MTVKPLDEVKSSCITDPEVFIVYNEYYSQNPKICLSMVFCMKDTLFNQAIDTVPEFQFDERVARVFPDMIERSIPGYRLLLEMIGLQAGKQATDNAVIYDLGCSLGAATLAMRRCIMAKGCRIIGVDNSAAMVERCKKIIDADNSRIPVELVHSDVNTIRLMACKVVVMNFTLQFLAPLQRDRVLEKIFHSLVPGGVLLLSEKIHLSDMHENSLISEWHHDFKRSQGYSDLEISQKRQALENVMRIDTEAIHIKRLNDIGFSHVLSFFQGLNFKAWLAIK